MKYVGGKVTLAKYIVPYIQKLLVNSNGNYYEPFVGGANIFCKVKANNKIGSDLDKELIDFLNYLTEFGADNLPYITEKIYNAIKKEPHKYKSHIVGYVSICGAFQGVKFSSYARPKEYCSNNGIYFRDYPLFSLNSVKRQSLELQQNKGKFIHSNYLNLQIPDNSVIYCDPPYKNSLNACYEANNFDHKEFWKWCRIQSKHSKLLISEYIENVPNDFKIIWSKEKRNKLSRTNKFKIETLSIKPRG